MNANTSIKGMLSASFHVVISISVVVAITIA